MSTHNIGFYEDLTKIIFELSSNTHLISSAGLAIFYWLFSLGLSVPRNSALRITYRPDMTSAVYHGCKKANQTKQKHFDCNTITSVSTSIVIQLKIGSLK